MQDRRERTREGIWAFLTTVVLMVRLVTAIGTVVLVIFWAIAAVRDSLDNDFLWPAVGCGAALLVSTYLYSWLRARYPRRNGRLL